MKYVIITILLTSCNPCIPNDDRAECDGWDQPPPRTAPPNIVAPITPQDDTERSPSVAGSATLPTDPLTNVVNTTTTNTIVDAGVEDAGTRRKKGKKDDDDNAEEEGETEEED